MIGKSLCIAALMLISGETFAIEPKLVKGGPAVRKHEVIIKGRDAATVTSTDIKLGDIAEISAQNPEADEAAAALQKIVICGAPKIGSSLTIGAYEIVERLKKEGVDLTKVGYVFPKMVSVSSAGRAPRTQEIQPVIEEFIKRVSPAAKLIGIQIPESVQISPQSTHFEVIPSIESPADMRKIKLTTRGDHALPVEFEVGVKVEDWREVPVARHGIQKGSIIGEGDMMMARLNLAGIPIDASFSTKEVVGQKALQQVGPGQVFRKGSLEVPAVIESGDRVTLMYRSRFLEASATGTALEAGAPGKIIKIRSELSNKVIVGTVVEAGLVEVRP